MLHIVFYEYSANMNHVLYYSFDNEFVPSIGLIYSIIEREDSSFLSYFLRLKANHDMR